MDDSVRSSSSNASSQFMATRWSIVLAAGESSGLRRDRALEELARAYWFPLYSFARRNGRLPAEAEDLVQGFFAHLLEKKSLSRVDQSLGKFRSFLLASFKHFISDEWDKARAQKRGGGAKVLTLDESLAEDQYKRMPVDEMTPEKLFDRNWAMALLSRVMTRLSQEYADKKQSALFDTLKGAIAGSATSISYAQAGTLLKMSESAVKMAAHRLRKAYRDILWDEIAQTVSNPDLVDDEIRFLMESL